MNAHQMTLEAAHEAWKAAKDNSDATQAYIVRIAAAYTLGLITEPDAKQRVKEVSDYLQANLPAGLLALANAMMKAGVPPDAAAKMIHEAMESGVDLSAVPPGGIKVVVVDSDGNARAIQAEPDDGIGTPIGQA